MVKFTSKQRTRYFVIVGLITIILFGVWWFAIRSTYWIDGKTITVSNDGVPHCVQFYVRDKFGNGVGGISVTAVDSSAGASAYTDETGYAIVKMYEDDLMEIGVGETFFTLHLPILGDLIHPSISRGVTVSVLIK